LIEIYFDKQSRSVYAYIAIWRFAMNDFIRVMKALSDPNRIKVVKMLQQKEMCVCEIQAALEIAQPTVSKHLKVLEDAGLVESRKDGLWVNYFASSGGLSPYAAMMLGSLKHWLSDDPDIRILSNRLPIIRRETILRKNREGIQNQVRQRK
jgi:ArsR family transcriptional regulator